MTVGTRDLVLIVDGVDCSAAVLSAAIRSVGTDSDFVSFRQAQHGGKRDYHLAIELFQDIGALSLWRVIWAGRGEDVPFELWPVGRPEDQTPTATQPRAVGVATIDHPDGEFLGGDADEDPQARMTTSVEWKCEDMPTLEPA